jgi:predicted amidohydrolase YtcJ
MRTLYRTGGLQTLALQTPTGPAEAAPALNALVVDDATIAWMGCLRAGDSAPGDVDRTVDLGDALLTPAFVDAHAHVTETGLLLRGVDLTGVRSLREILDQVAAAAGRGDVPVLGHGWDETRLAEHRPPTAAELDRAAAGAAVYLSRVDVHSAVISPALARACGAHDLDGWDGTGRVERDAHHAARTAIRSTLTPTARRTAQLTALGAAARAGIAAIHEMSAPSLAPDDDLRALVALVQEPGTALPDIVPYRSELVTTLDEAKATVERLGVRLAGLAGDLTADGSVGSRTAAYREDYADAPGHRGHLYLTVEQVRDHVAACTRAGLQAGFHVIGDAAMDVVRRGIRRAAGQVGIAAVRAARHRLEHVEAIDAEGIADLVDLSITASVQPVFDALWGGAEGMYADRLGPQRALAMNPLGAFARAGVRLAFGSDSPVTPFDPWGAVRACVAHHAPGQRLSPREALEAHTTGGWRAARTDDAGVLAVGAPATFAAWQVPSCQAEPGTLPVLDDDGPPPRCTLTVSRGRVLHDAAGRVP